ncbi:YTH family protein [Actinidia rufa]|uniref:YTH domain-containing family protein n=1 Tax=Actinidia rufa TaxID=165716 RepID=A0A7J0FTH6_9ERIC|nr:YTH family protein [Actinidia rufa]
MCSFKLWFGGLSIGELIHLARVTHAESPSYKGNEDAFLARAEVQGHNCGRLGSAIIKGESCGTRYFIIKSLSHENIQLSIEKGIWATQVMNEPILEEAFHNSSKVILIFSVNMSGFFQGYAQMMTSVGWRRDNVWSQGSGGKNPWGRSFKVKWLQLHDLPFQKTLHLKNPLNDYKPVKISRDCQELPRDIGEALCELLDGKDDTDSNLNRDDLPSKRPCIEPSCAMRHEERDMPAVHMTWDQTHMLYPPLLYQHQAETSRFHLAHLPITSGASKAPGTKHSQINGSLNGVQLDRNNSSRLDAWGWSAERSPLASTLTEDDILEMCSNSFWTRSKILLEKLLYVILTSTNESIKWISFLSKFRMVCHKQSCMFSGINISIQHVLI